MNGSWFDPEFERFVISLREDLTREIFSYCVKHDVSFETAFNHIISFYFGFEKKEDLYVLH